MDIIFGKDKRDIPRFTNLLYNFSWKVEGKTGRPAFSGLPHQICVGAPIVSRRIDRLRFSFWNSEGSTL